VLKLGFGWEWTKDEKTKASVCNEHRYMDGKGDESHDRCLI
jgi:hypothetical protein